MNYNHIFLCYTPLSKYTTHYLESLLRHQLRIFSCPVRMLQLEFTITNYSRSPTFRPQGQTVFSERIVNAWNVFPDSVDFSYLSRFKRSIHKVDFSRFLKCFWGAFIMLYIMYIWYILCIFVCFKATVRACCLSLVSLVSSPCFYIWMNAR